MTTTTTFCCNFALLRVDFRQSIRALRMVPTILNR